MKKEKGNNPFSFRAVEKQNSELLTQNRLLSKLNYKFIKIAYSLRALLD
jgi:hypothetical protein